MSDIIIKLKGGAGNQLFQTIAALSLAKIYGKHCRFSSENINKNKYKRKLEILPLLNELKVLEHLKIENKNIIYLDQYDIDHPIYFSENSPLSKLKTDIQIEGYFSNYRIHNKEVFKKIKSHIKGRNIIQKFRDLNFIAIHIRELHGTGKNKINNSIDNLNIDYYSKCLYKIFQNNSNQKLNTAIVFSDTWKNPEKSSLIPKVKNLLKNYGIKYINGDKEISSTLDIVNIFSHSKFCIISNSTLSWWGAYLSDGIVFSPVMNIWEPNLKVPDSWNQIYSNEINLKTHHKKSIFETCVLKEKAYNNRIYNPKRLKLIKFTRLIINKVNSTNIYIKFKRWLRSKGVLPENSHSTFV